MGAVTDRARELADQLKAGLPAGSRVETSIRKVRTPCVLVVPVPEYDFDRLGQDQASLTWTIVVLGSLPADLRSSEDMEELVLGVAEILPIETAVPSSYPTGQAEDPLPSYVLTMTDEVEF